MRNMLVRGFAVIAYAAFVASFVYFSAFVCGLVAARAGSGVAEALAIDLGLVALFGATHSIMARQRFKRMLHRIVPADVERSLFVLVASVELGLVAFEWRSVGATLWTASGALAVLLRAAQLGGIGIVLVSSFLIDHLELFGLRQAFSPASPPPRFGTPGLYRLVRHPLYLGMLIAFWVTPAMGAGRLFLAAALTAYVLVGVRLEERDLVRAHGEPYVRYQQAVPRLVPVPRPRQASRRMRTA